MQAHCSACSRTIQNTESATRRFTTRCMPMPRVELRRELIACLRWIRAFQDSCCQWIWPHRGNAKYSFARAGSDGSFDSRALGSKGKGARNRSAVGTFVERATLMVVAKMPDGTAQSALDSFSEALSEFFLNCAKPSPTTKGVR